MMNMYDKFLAMSEGQAITATADSTEVLDLTKDGNSLTTQLWWILRVNTPFTTSAETLSASLQTATDSSFAELPGCAMAAKAASAMLTKGEILVKQPIPFGLKRKLKTVYTCSDALAAGKVDSFLTVEPWMY